MKIIFAGTPEFAVPSLRALHGAGHEITVLTQPDRPQGRKKILKRKMYLYGGRDIHRWVSLLFLCFKKV